MKKYENITKKTARQLLMHSALVICFGFAGFALPLSHGQKVTKQKVTPTQKISQEKSISPQQVTTVQMNFKPVKVSETELKTIREAFPEISAKSIQSLNRVQTVERTTLTAQPIEVISPANNDEWEAGREYIIKWNGGGGDVRIDLESALEERPLVQYPIISQMSNTGTYRFRVPYNWVTDPYGYVVRIKTLDGKQSATNRGTISVYTQPVDLECKIVDAKLRRQTNYYIIYNESKRWLEFNVLMRNKGVQSPVTIQNVLVRIIKEPEGVVVAQEEWGFSGIYHHDWYKLSEARKFNISSIEAAPFYVDKDVNFESGNYRVEVELDPQNRLRENQECRYDNKDVQHWRIH
jgi:hypothetical protein